MLWYEEKNTGVAVSTRIRFARNLDGIPFPSHLGKEKYTEVNSMIRDAVLSCNLDGISLRAIDMGSLGETEAYAMVERHVISPQFAVCREGSVLLLSDDESVSIMIGEEDHLRIQVLKSGELIDDAFAVCDRIDTEIGKKLKFAFDDRLGFLTECPTNLGTGMRASVMLHLPVLESTGELKSIADAVGKIGLTFRGFYGEGSDSKASIYQLSNQITLGVSEKAALENLKNIASQIIAKETAATSELDSGALEDLVYRSYGILKYARRITTDEMMKYVSGIMLGERTGIIHLPNDISPMNIFITMQPAMIKRVNGDIGANERDELRAKSIRDILSSTEC